MLPAASQEHRFFNFHPASPSHRQHNKSSQLPYFKRFPNSRFLSQERKRFEKVELRQMNSPHRHSQHRASFFRRQKQSFVHRSNKSEDLNEVETPNRHQDNKKFFRQAYDRQSKQNRHKTESSFEIRLKSLAKQKKNKSVFTALEILSNQNNLTLSEKQQILEFNEIYYYGENCVKTKIDMKEDSKDDGSYRWQKNDHIYFRFQILDILGEGSFGEVFKCLDHKRGKALVAVKIIKDNEKYTKQAKIEIQILNQIKAKDPSGVKNCIQLRQSFTFRNRMCLTFDLLSINLYELIKSNGYYGLPLDLLRRMSLQILNALHFLHKNQIIHADLKPENVLLKEANKSGVKVIDFGSSCFENQTVYTYIQSRYYRAPQVILGLPYDRKIDIWSFACIIAELHLGFPIFAGDQEHEQICLFVQVLGMPPAILSNSAKRWNIFFDQHNSLKAPGKKTSKSPRSLKTALQNPQDSDFTDFLLKCLAWRAEERCEALDCMNHSWILKGLPEQIREQHLKFLAEEHEGRECKMQKKPKSFSLHNHRNRLIH